jgi:hypothetical protein
MLDIVRHYYYSSLHLIHPKTAYETTLQPITYLFAHLATPLTALQALRLILVHPPPSV